MNISDVITSMGRSWGGPALTTLLAVKGLRKAGVNAEILTYGVQGTDKPISTDDFIIFQPPLSWVHANSGWSVSMRRALRKASPDIFHIQGLWQYPQYEAAKTAHERNIPYIITLHGQLHPQALAYSACKKKTAMHLYQKRQLQQAACIQATCMEEYRNYRALGFTNPVAVIPNPIDCTGHKLYGRTDRVKRMGFLGRLYPYKNVMRLLEVWERLQVKEGVFLIMGDGDLSYRKLLQDKIKRSGLTNVFFTGYVAGEKKQQLLASLSCLVVPSDFENFGMIVPEALLQNVPVIASTGSPWEELNTHRCGWWVDNDADTLAGTIREALSLDEQTRYEMGCRGRRLIQQKYAMEVVAAQMESLYNWVLGNGGRPDFVFTD